MASLVAVDGGTDASGGAEAATETSTLGSIAYLTDDELYLLDEYEGGYKRRCVSCCASVVGCRGTPADVRHLVVVTVLPFVKVLLGKLAIQACPQGASRGNLGENGGLMVCGCTPCPRHTAHWRGAAAR